jgi:L-alanine-DL-glutamate epimerase-like enolase superfamily enzyme
VSLGDSSESCIDTQLSRSLRAPFPFPPQAGGEGTAQPASASKEFVFRETDAGDRRRIAAVHLECKRLVLLDAMARSFVGSDPDFVERFWSAACGDTDFLGQSGVSVFGIAALDGALWDCGHHAAPLLA